PVFVGLTGRANAMADAPPLYRLTRWQQFDALFPGDGVSRLLACAVRGFFENGGQYCHVMPLDLDPDPGEGRDASFHAAEVAEAIRASFAAGGVLDSLEDADLVCVPDVMTPVLAASPERVFELQACIVDYCARMGERFAILDAYAGDPSRVVDGGTGGSAGDGANAVLLAAVRQWQALPPNYGAIYFPWIHVRDHRATRDTPVSGVLVPPCGHVAGVYARSDRRDGVQKPPANELLEGALDLGCPVSDSDQQVLNDAGVNCLRQSAGWGIRVWGARTLSDRPAWIYVNVTRVMLALTRWLEQNLRDLVFEPNSPRLWAFIEERISGHCGALFRLGALKGRNASEAYFVKCDAETNEQFSRDSGVVVAQVGLAPAAPGEFIIVRITQGASGVTVTGPTGWE
ncbi:MAG TPA: phage tail sheath subtilisin-like domain-containing protein, partial [Paraburkholderia sp.]|nr:phage tail sheath subtilisin-like domain-containing protein [Paraburkholderia sp.]